MRVARLFDRAVISARLCITMSHCSFRIVGMGHEHIKYQFVGGLCHVNTTNYLCAAFHGEIGRYQLTFSIKYIVHNVACQVSQTVMRSHESISVHRQDNI